jgi:hypothetical protein
VAWCHTQNTPLASPMPGEAAGGQGAAGDGVIQPTPTARAEKPVTVKKEIKIAEPKKVRRRTSRRCATGFVCITPTRLSGGSVLALRPHTPANAARRGGCLNPVCDVPQG